MIITFSGGKNGWVEYVLDGTENKPRDTNLVEIIDGDFELTKKIYQSTNFKENYTRGVISFEGKVDKEKMKEVWEDFKKEFFVGYEEEEYNVSAIMHLDSDNDHIHFCIPKLNLLTQQTNQMYMDKLDRNRINSLKEWLELKHFSGTGYKTLERTPTKQDKTLEYIDIWREEHGQEKLKFDTKRQLDKTTKIINNFILEQTKLGNINNFEGVQMALKSFEIDIVKIGIDTINNFDYITIQDPISQKKLRLKGEVYGQDFWTSNTKDRTNTRTTDTRDREHKQNINTTITNSYNKLQQHNDKRVEYLEKRYSNARARAKNKIGDSGIGNIDNNNVFIGDIVGNDTKQNISIKEEKNENINTTTSKNEISSENTSKERIQGIGQLIGRNRRQMDRTGEGIQDIADTIHKTGIRIQDITKRVNGGIGTMKKEIDIFKEDISLTDFILSNGGEINNLKSCKNYDVIDFKGDKLIVSKNKNGQYQFFNQEGKGGTIIDFYKMYVKDLPYGKIVGNIRKYHNGENEYTYKKDKTTKDTMNILKEIDTLNKEINPTYLEDFRKISRETFLVFKDKIRQDNNNNICFIHSHYKVLDSGKLDIENCGIEKKNKDFKGHTGEKGIWGKEIGDSKEIFIFESPFDLMSFYELNKKEGIYISTGGNIGEEGIKDILEIIKYKEVEKVNYCLDNDQGGDLLKHRLNMYLSILKNIEIKEIKPTKKDFNEDLQDKKEKGKDYPFSLFMKKEEKGEKGNSFPFLKTKENTTIQEEKIREIEIKGPGQKHR